MKMVSHRFFQYRMKICLVNSLYPPFSRGGAETVVGHTAAGLRAAGHEVGVITLGRQPGREVVDGIVVERVRSPNLTSFLDLARLPLWLRPLWHALDMVNIVGCRRGLHVIERERPDVVMTHVLKGMSYLLPRALARRGVAHVHVLHDVQLSRPSGLLLYGAEKPFLLLDMAYEKACRWLFGSPAVVLSPSRWLLDYYTVRGFFPKSRRVVLPNPVAQLRTPSGETAPDGVVRLMFIGQLERSKGVWLLLETLRHLPERNWLLRVVGSGGQEDRLRERFGAHPQVKFYGRQSHAAINQLLAQTDLTVVPSVVYENSPTAITESLAMGVPVIAADIGGIPELVHDGINGHTFAPNDAANLAKVLTYYLQRPGEITRLRQQTVDSVRSSHLPEYIQRLLGHIASIAQP